MRVPNYKQCGGTLPARFRRFEAAGVPTAMQGGEFFTLREHGRQADLRSAVSFPPAAGGLRLIHFSVLHNIPAGRVHAKNAPLRALLVQLRP